MIVVARALPAQTLSLKRALPTPSDVIGPVCAPVPRAASPAPKDLDEARRLTTQAHEQAIIGDNGAARDLFRRAAKLDPTDPNIAFQLARAEEHATDTTAAAREYCRFLALAPNAPEAAEALERATTFRPASARPPALSDRATIAFKSGLQYSDLKQWKAADSAFSVAIQEAPSWPEPYYDRAVALSERGEQNQAARDLAKYLQLRPEAEDRAAVVARINGWQRRPFQPGTALAMGLVVPGMGQLYTRRPAIGLAVLGGVGAGVYLALRSKISSETRTFTDVFGFEHQYQVQVKSHPTYYAGIATAAGVAALGAVEAFMYARRTRDVTTLAAPTRVSALEILPGVGGGVTVGVRIGVW
jgi:Flp pilus assembly protein TadD